MKGFPGVVNSFYYLAFVAVLAWASHIEQEQGRIDGPAPASVLSVVPKIVPIILVAADMQDSPDLDEAEENAQSVMAYAQQWYLDQVGSTFQVGRTLRVKSELTSNEWIALAELSKVDEHRFDYHTTARREVLERLGRSDTHHYIASIFAGLRPDIWWGAADSGDVSVVAPRGTGVLCPGFSKEEPLSDPVCSDAVYAVVHELGHAFGLEKYSCDGDGAQDPICHKSAMQAQRPPGMIFLEHEKQVIRANKYFSQPN